MDRKHTPRKPLRPIVPAWTHPRELSDAELLDLAIAELENRERSIVSTTLLLDTVQGRATFDELRKHTIAQTIVGTQRLLDAGHYDPKRGLVR